MNFRVIFRPDRGLSASSALLLSGLILLLSVRPAPGQVVLTGNAALDFGLDPEAVVVNDGPDALMPGAYSYPVSGWDVDRVFFRLDAGTLYIGIDTFVIAGDADGDGNPGSASTELSSFGGADYANYQASEMFQLAFDLNQDGIFDLITGINNPGTGGAISLIVGTNNGTIGQAAWGSLSATYPEHIGPQMKINPSAGEPDLEYSLLNFLQLADTLGIMDSDPYSFNIQLYHGSAQDNGIDDEFIPSTPVTIPEPSVWGCLLLGLALLGWKASRLSRKRKGI